MVMRDTASAVGGMRSSRGGGEREAARSASPSSVSLPPAPASSPPPPTAPPWLLPWPLPPSDPPPAPTAPWPLPPSHPSSFEDLPLRVRERLKLTEESDFRGEARCITELLTELVRPTDPLSELERRSSLSLRSLSFGWLGGCGARGCAPCASLRGTTVAG